VVGDEFFGQISLYFYFLFFEQNQAIFFNFRPLALSIGDVLMNILNQVSLSMPTISI